MGSFFKEAIGSIRTSGTVKPSSKYLIRNCLKDIDFSSAKTILEFGTGNGCFTQEISQNMARDTQLYSFEVNPFFHVYASRKFESYKNVHILNSSALHFDHILKDHAIQQVDYVISSLPLTLFKKSDTQMILQKVGTYLKQGGCFVQYQYSLNNYLQLRKAFDGINIDLTIRNFPPAFIYKCTNRQVPGMRYDV